MFSETLYHKQKEKKNLESWKFDNFLKRFHRALQDRGSTQGRRVPFERIVHPVSVIKHFRWLTARVGFFVVMVVRPSIIDSARWRWVVPARARIHPVDKLDRRAIDQIKKKNISQLTLTHVEDQAEEPESENGNNSSPLTRARQHGHYYHSLPTTLFRCFLFV